MTSRGHEYLNCIRVGVDISRAKFRDRGSSSFEGVRIDRKTHRHTDRTALYIYRLAGFRRLGMAVPGVSRRLCRTLAVRSLPSYQSCQVLFS